MTVNLKLISPTEARLVVNRLHRADQALLVECVKALGYQLAELILKASEIDFTDEQHGFVCLELIDIAMKGSAGEVGKYVPTPLPNAVSEAGHA
ncbi:MAG: hypothetical protein HQL84_16050 [Magnetococcales bacterium]|nr:hypothetical protein [Magnetococcales bacterium]